MSFKEMFTNYAAKVSTPVQTLRVYLPNWASSQIGVSLREPLTPIPGFAEGMYRHKLLGRFDLGRFSSYYASIRPAFGPFLLGLIAGAIAANTSGLISYCAAITAAAVGLCMAVEMLPYLLTIPFVVGGAISLAHKFAAKINASRSEAYDAAMQTFYDDRYYGVVGAAAPSSDYMSHAVTTALLLCFITVTLLVALWPYIWPFVGKFVGANAAVRKTENLSEMQKRHLESYMKHLAWTPWALLVAPVAIYTLTRAVISLCRLLVSLRQSGVAYKHIAWSGWNYSIFGVFLACSSFHRWWNIIPWPKVFGIGLLVGGALGKMALSVAKENTGGIGGHGSVFSHDHSHTQ